MSRRCRPWVGAITATVTAVTLTFGNAVSMAQEDPTPPATTAPPPIAREPLPPPEYQNTPQTTAPRSQLPNDICTPVTETGAAQQGGPAMFSATPQFSEAWWLERLRIDEVGEIATGEGVTIAVIDTGIALGSSEFTPTDRFSAWDVLPPPSGDQGYDCGHGTAVASLIAGNRATTLTDFQGIAPGARVIGIRSLASTENQPIDGVVAAIRSAIEMNVDIINISQAAFVNRGEYQDAIRAALDAGIVVVAAAGNGEGTALAYPAAYDGVIAVGMTDRADVPSPASLRMPGYISVAAPGVDMMAPAPSSNTQMYQYLEFGTSYATPLVSGTAALLIQQARDRQVELTPAQVKARLEATADPPAGPVPDAQVGYGVVNPLRALIGNVPVRDGDGAPQSTSPYVPPGPIEPPNPWPLRIALSVSGLSIGLVLFGFGLNAALPAARRRGGRPASPTE